MRQSCSSYTANTDLLRTIIQGYQVDVSSPWSMNEHNTAELWLYNGMYWKSGALVIPNVHKLNVAIFKELHDDMVTLVTMLVSHQLLRRCTRPSNRDTT